MPLSEPIWESKEEKQEKFIDNLSTGELREFEEYQEMLSNFYHQKSSYINIVIEGIEGENIENNQEIISEFEENSQLLEINEKLNQSLARLVDTLSAEKLKDFYKLFQLDSNNNPEFNRPNFDLSKIQRWIVKRVFDMGWSAEKFGVFDNYIRNQQRVASKPERIGKKYQWIAYHEILARIADHFQYRSEYDNEPSKSNYEGTWQLHVRDIDPSCVLHGKKEDASILSAWWFPMNYNGWDLQKDHSQWVAEGKITRHTDAIGK